MKLPENIRNCIDLLEQAGYRAYAVGGCVRDSFLGMTPHDYDLCTDARPHEISRVFDGYPQIHQGEKHGTVGIIDGGVVEITTFRKEGTYKDHRHPDWVDFVGDLREDLARRDFTINAMAYHPAEGYIDCFGGREDLKNGILRAVGNPEQRFREDALRILRGVRFASRFGLTPEPETYRAMAELAPLLGDLARERVFEELNRLLAGISAEDLILYAPVLVQTVPALAPTVGFRQHNPHHIHTVYDHIAHVTAAVPGEPTLKWAALLHDVGKPQCFTRDAQGVGHFYGHAAISAAMADEALRILKAPTELRRNVTALVEHHMVPPQATEKIVARRAAKLGWEQYARLLELQMADGCDRETCLACKAILDKTPCLKITDLAIGGRELMDMGVPAGKQMGEILCKLLDLVIDGEVANEKEALLSAAGSLV